MDEATMVSLTPLLQALGSVLTLVLTGLAGMVMNWLAKKTGYTKLQQDQVIRGYLETAIDNGVRLAIKRFSESPAAHINLQYEVAATAVQYVVDKTPDAVKHFKLDRKQIEDIALARIDTIENEKRIAKALP